MRVVLLVLLAALLSGCQAAIAPALPAMQAIPRASPTPAPVVPPWPECPAGYQRCVAFGGATAFFYKDQNRAELVCTVDAPAEALITGWTGVGHRWDAGCQPGDANDAGRFPCDQSEQDSEVVAVELNGTLVGLTVDPGTDQNIPFEFPAALHAGTNTLVLRHGGNPGHSVFYLGVLCAALPAMPTATPQEPATATATATPQEPATPTATPQEPATATATATATLAATATVLPTQLLTDTPTATSPALPSRTRRPTAEVVAEPTVEPVATPMTLEPAPATSTATPVPVPAFSPPVTSPAPVVVLPAVLPATGAPARDGRGMVVVVLSLVAVVGAAWGRWGSGQRE